MGGEDWVASGEAEEEVAGEPAPGSGEISSVPAATAIYSDMTFMTLLPTPKLAAG